MEEINPSSEDKHKYNLKGLRPRRKKLPNVSDMLYVEDLVTAVQCALCVTQNSMATLEDENDLEYVMEEHEFETLQKALEVPQKASEVRLMVSKKFLTLFRTGKLGSFVLDDVPDAKTCIIM
ncbi:hypothetical protein SLE2022_135930 [Rubroshorea leprosula]